MRAAPELLYDSEATLRLVDSAITELVRDAERIAEAHPPSDIGGTVPSRQPPTKPAATPLKG